MRKIAVILTLLLASCAQLEVVIPNPRIETPEVRGEEAKWKLGVDTIPAHVFKVAENAGARPLNLNDPGVRGHLDIVPSAAYSVSERVEVAAELNTFGKGVGALVKWQVNGSGTVAPEAQSHPIALYARVGRNQATDKGDQKDTFGAGGYNWNGTIVATCAQAGLSLGYRPSELFMFYGGVSMGQHWVRSKIDQDATGTDPGGSYSQNDHGDAKTAGAGLSFRWSVVQLAVSSEYTWFNYTKAQDKEDLFTHLGVTFTPYPPH